MVTQGTISKYDFDRDLIEEIERHELIYNIRCRDYRNAQKKEKVWKAITQKLNADEDHVRRRWKGLRDTYKKNRRALDVNPKGKVKRWKYFRDMSFLDNFDDAKGNLTSIQNVVVKNQPLSDDDLDGEEEQDDFQEDEALYEESFAYEPSKSNSNVTEVDMQFENFNSHSPTKTMKQEQHKKSSTDLLFESLARKIQESNLMESEVNEIECKVMSLVYSEIEKCRENLVSSSIEKLLK